MACLVPGQFRSTRVPDGDRTSICAGLDYVPNARTTLSFNYAPIFATEEPITLTTVHCASTAYAAVIATNETNVEAHVTNAIN